jgi:hypothetical protein
MKSDISILQQIASSRSLNGMALLSALDIDAEQMEAIKNGQSNLRIAERMLLTILIKNPNALDFSASSDEEFTFSITSWRKALKSVDEEVEDLLVELRKEQKKSGLSVDEFMAGTRKTNSHRLRVHEFFTDLHRRDLIGKDAARIYQTPFWKSFKSGDVFKRSNFGTK